MAHDYVTYIWYLLKNNSLSQTKEKFIFHLDFSVQLNNLLQITPPYTFMREGKGFVVRHSTNKVSWSKLVSPEKRHHTETKLLHVQKYFACIYICLLCIYQLKYNLMQVLPVRYYKEKTDRSYPQIVEKTLTCNICPTQIRDFYSSY